MTLDKGFLRRLKGILVSPADTFDSIIETRPPPFEPTVIFLSFGLAALLINGVMSFLNPFTRAPLPVIPASLLSPLINAVISCLALLLILRAIERLKGLRWEIDFGLLYTILGFSAIPLLISSFYSRVSFYAVSSLTREPSEGLLFISKTPSLIFAVWSAYLLALGLNRHYFRHVSPKEHITTTVLGALLILGAFNLLHPLTLYRLAPLGLWSALAWIFLGVLTLAVWSRAERYTWARLALLGVLALAVMTNTGLLYASVSEQEARMVENMRTAEVEFTIGVFTNGDVRAVTVMVPIPFFRDQPLDLKSVSTLHDMIRPASWGITSTMTI